MKRNRLPFPLIFDIKYKRNNYERLTRRNADTFSNSSPARMVSNKTNFLGKMTTPIVAIIGRPNVGKSTFFNRLLSKRRAIVDKQEGITRDRIYGEMEWNGQNLKFIDTGGLIYDDKGDFNNAVRTQANEAIGEADFVILMVDGKQGIMPNDKILANTIRKTNKYILIVVNKCDEYKSDNLVHQFYELGIKDILPISSLNGRLTGDLLDEILKKLISIKQKN